MSVLCGKKIVICCVVIVAFQGTILLNGPNLKRRPIVQKIGELPVVAGKIAVDSACF